MGQIIGMAIVFLISYTIYKTQGYDNTSDYGVAFFILFLSVFWTILVPIGIVIFMFLLIVKYWGESVEYVMNKLKKED